MSTTPQEPDPDQEPLDPDANTSYGRDQDAEPPDSGGVVADSDPVDDDSDDGTED